MSSEYKYTNTGSNTDCRRSNERGSVCLCVCICVCVFVNVYVCVCTDHHFTWWSCCWIKLEVCGPLWLCGVELRCGCCIMGSHWERKSNRTQVKDKTHGPPQMREVRKTTLSKLLYIPTYLHTLCLPCSNSTSDLILKYCMNVVYIRNM